MAAGDVTTSVVGVFKTNDIAAGVTGQNVSTQYISGANLIYLPLGKNIVVLKEVRAA